MLDYQDPHGKHKQVLTVLNCARILSPNYYNNTIKHTLTFGPFGDSVISVPCQHQNRSLGAGIVWSHDPKFKDLFDTKTDIKEITIESLANQYNGHCIWFLLVPGIPHGRKHLYRTYYIYIYDSNNGYPVSRLPIQLNKNKCIEITLNQNNQTININCVAPLISVERICTYKIYNMTPKTHFVNTMVTTNHNLNKKDKCEKGWIIPFTHSMTFGQLILKNQKSKVDTEKHSKLDFQCIFANVLVQVKNKNLVLSLESNADWGVNV